MKHSATYEITRYPYSKHAREITRTCSCGNRGTIHDSQAGATLAMARAAQRRHVEHATAKANA